jgi:spore coat protein U-like protein
LYGQNNEQISVQVQASLKRGISINSETNVLNFGEIVLSNSNQIINKSPQEGLRFQIVSHPDKPVLINFNEIRLSSNGNQSGPTFIPKVVQTGSSIKYVNPIEVQSGVYNQPEVQDGEGILNLWIGGSLIINQSNLQGDYSGTLTITITY